MASNVSDRICVLEGDITTLDVDAVVNAANEALAGGVGVDYAIHAAAGPELGEECLALGGCPTGEARMTRGHRLLARYVIHAVGPEYLGGGYREDELLASCYRESLRLAMESKLETIAFPCISTGMFLYPRAAACDIAVSTVVEWLATHALPRMVTFCCLLPEDARLYRKRLAR
jgi:O-acetyl-ADP-ribose deacetylase (regulator of RNase III)